MVQGSIQMQDRTVLLRRNMTAKNSDCADRYLPLVVNRYDTPISIGSSHQTAIVSIASPSLGSALVTQSSIVGGFGFDRGVNPPRSFGCDDYYWRDN
jgi:hypothetical protein